MDITEPRLTTREVAERLQCLPAEALTLLKAAGIPHTRSGTRGPILWSAAAADRLLAALQPHSRTPISEVREARGIE